MTCFFGANAGSFSPFFAARETVAPTLTNPVDTATGQTTASLSVDTNEGNGTLYWVVTTSSTKPSKAQVKAGQNHLGASAAASGSQAVSSTGTKNASATGLTASTAYFAHFMHEDAAGNQSTVVSGDGFTTSAILTEYALAYKLSNQTSIDAAVITFGAEVADAANIHDNSTNPSRFTVPSAWNGRYGRMSGGIDWSTSSRPIMSTRKNGASYLGQANTCPSVIESSKHQSCFMAAPIVISTGDYFEIHVDTGIHADGSVLATEPTWGQMEILPSPFAGALVHKNADQSISSGVTAAVTFQSEVYDTGNYHDVSSNTDRLTVGAGIWRLMGNMVTGSGAGQFVLSITRDGAAVAGLPVRDADQPSLEVLNGVSAPISVASSAYFVMNAFHTSNSSVLNDNGTWFAVEKLPDNLKRNGTLLDFTRVSDSSRLGALEECADEHYRGLSVLSDAGTGD